MSKTTKTPKYVYVLRTCDADMTAHGGFRWPKRGWVEAPDYRDDFVCGGGLHGLPMGEGGASLLNGEPDAIWLVVRVLAKDIRHGQGDMTDKCKFRRGYVIYAGTRDGALDLLKKKGASGERMIYGQATASGVGGQATASGDGGQATASGNYGQATANGVGGQATASGDYGQATASGYKGQATASGNYSQATASGDGGFAMASHGGAVRAGNRGVFAIMYWDETANRPRLAVGYVGENGIKPETLYRYDTTTSAFIEVPE